LVGQRGCWFSWKLHTRLVELFSSSGNRDNRDPGYLEQGFKQGALSVADLTAIKNCVTAAPLKSIKESNPLTWYAYTPMDEQDVSVYAKWFRCYDLSSQREVLYQVLLNIVPQIRKCLGYGVRIVNVRCFGMLPNSPELNANLWHSDTFPKGVQKLIIYITPAGPLTGTTELRLNNGGIFSVEGPPGSWVFFNSTNIVHRGKPSKTEERITLEITTVPTFKENASLVFPGDNAAYPLYPWIKTNYP